MDVRVANQGIQGMVRATAAFLQQSVLHLQVAIMLAQCDSKFHLPKQTRLLLRMYLPQQPFALLGFTLTIYFRKQLSL